MFLFVCLFVLFFVFVLFLFLFLFLFFCASLFKTECIAQNLGIKKIIEHYKKNGKTIKDTCKNVSRTLQYQEFVNVEIIIVDMSKCAER